MYHPDAFITYRGTDLLTLLLYYLLSGHLTANMFISSAAINFVDMSNVISHADNRVLVMPRAHFDILKKVSGMHAQVVTKPSLAASGQLTIMPTLAKLNINVIQ